MKLPPLQIVAYLLAAVLLNLWLRRVWAVPVTRPRAAPERRHVLWLGVAALLALGLAGAAMLGYRSEQTFLAVVLFLPLQVLAAAVWFFRYNRACGRPIGWRRFLVGNSLVLLLPITLALAAGELWMRYCRDTTDSIGYTKVARRWLERHYQFNQFHLRDDIEYSLEIAPGKRRVTFVGDSFTAGHGIADVDQRVANRIRRWHPDWEVHVLAHNGDDTGAEITNLEVATANGYQLDEVVLVYCLNDVQDLLTGWKVTLDAAAAKAAQRCPIFDDSYLLDTLYYRVAIATLPGVGDYFSFVDEAYRGQVWQTQQQRLRALQQVVTQHGGHLSVVTWPFLHALGKDYRHAEAHANLAAFWQAALVPQLDLLPLLREYPSRQLTVNPFDAHPNEFASEIAAKAIDAWLLDVLAKAPKAGRK